MAAEIFPESSREDPAAFRLVIGGLGVCGGLIAGALRRLPGVSVTVYDRVGVDDHKNAGNGLNIGPNALQVLERAEPAQARALEAASLPWGQWLARDATGRVLMHVPLDAVAPRPGIRIRWSELYRIVRASALDLTRFHHQLTGLRETGAGVALDLAGNGAGPVSLGADLLLGCEGRYSGIREKIFGRPGPTHLGIGNFRTLIDGADAPGIDDMEQWYNGPARIIAFLLADGRIYISGNVPLVPGEEVDAHTREKETLRAIYSAPDGRTDPRLAWLIERFCAPGAVHHWARAQQIPSAFASPAGRVLLLGDASHAMAPTLGQGATQAVEDAAAFILLFRRWYDRHNGEPGRLRADAPALSAAFTRLRAERIAFVRQFSWDSSDPLLLGADPDALVPEKASPHNLENFRRLYHEQPDLDDATLFEPVPAGHE